MNLEIKKENGKRRNNEMRSFHQEGIVIASDKFFKNKLFYV
jgi:hypothetical protein